MCVCVVCIGIYDRIVSTAKILRFTNKVFIISVQ